MNKNVGSYDAAARFVLGCGLLALANHGHAWGWSGLGPVATAAIGFCPVCRLLRVDTRAADERTDRWPEIEPEDFSPREEIGSTALFQPRDWRFSWSDGVPGRLSQRQSEPPSGWDDGSPG